MDEMLRSRERKKREEEKEEGKEEGKKRKEKEEGKGKSLVPSQNHPSNEKKRNETQRKHQSNAMDSTTSPHVEERHLHWRRPVSQSI